MALQNVNFVIKLFSNDNMIKMSLETCSELKTNSINDPVEQLR